jgi:hypothetical protein
MRGEGKYYCMKRFSAEVNLKVWASTAKDGGMVQITSTDNTQKQLVPTIDLVILVDIATTYGSCIVVKT